MLYYFAGEPFKNTVPAIKILGELLGDKDMCYEAVDGYPRDKLYREVSCPEPEKGLVFWRGKCMNNLIMSSDINDIRDRKIR